MIIPSDITVLESLLALNLKITLWSATKKMSFEDLSPEQLSTIPPADLASLGSKRIANPQTLKVFSALKARATSFLDRYGIRFMSGWALPESKADIVVDELVAIREEFLKAKQDFLASYDESVQEWISKHAEWASLLENSILSSEKVAAKLGFAWQFYKVSPSDLPIKDSGLTEEVQKLGTTLFSDLSRQADDIWKQVLLGKTEVTHKALRPIKTLLTKLEGLSFVEPHVTPVTEIIDATLRKIPKKGIIQGSDLVLLQGLVSMLRDGKTLLEHAEKLMMGQSVDTLITPPVVHIPVPMQKQAIPSAGLW